VVPRRKALRLRTFDYSTPGAYFVTICVARKACVLGRVVGTTVELSEKGAVVARHLTQLAGQTGVSVDCFVVMPNHVHAVLVLGGGRELGTLVGSFKSATTREINARRGVRSERLWQRGYFDHVVRDDDDLDRVRVYVATNPIRWSTNS
jgi:REP element-mobilizing transposase RayT